MIEIKKIEFTAVVREIINKFNLNAGENDIVMGVFDGPSVIGAGSLSLKGAKVYLSDLKLDENNNNTQMFLSLARSVLFHADLKGIKTVYANNEEIYPVLKLLRFKENEDELSLELEGFFTSECN